MSEEFEVEIDGALFTVRRVSALEQITAEKESRELEAELDSHDAELIARACLLSKSLYADEKPVFENGLDVLKSLTAEKVYELTKREIIRETVYEKRDTSGEAIKAENESQLYVKPLESTESTNYRRRAEELSRFLKRDSRRYDGYYEMY